MNNIYSSIINFFDKNNEIDYQKIKKLLEHNLRNGQNNFYLRTDNFSFSRLNFSDKKIYYSNLIKLMPAESNFLIQFNFSSLSDIKTVIEELNLFKREFEVVIKVPFFEEMSLDFYFEDCMKYINYLNANNKINFYINFESRLLNLIDSQRLIEKSVGVDKLQGFVIDPVFLYDLDFKKIRLIKEKYENRFKFLVFADDFHYLNLDLGFKTISKYFNLFPNFFKNMDLEFENNSLAVAKEQQLVLNEFIQVVKNLGEAEAFKYLLAKVLAFEFEPINSLSESEKLDLELEFNKINKYIVDKV